MVANSVVNATASSFNHWRIWVGH